MMRSMYSAVSGLRAHQTKMDVIGNNIANVNTVGFKKGQVTFQEVFSEVVRGAGAPQGGKGGTNPQQIGLGVNIGAIDTIHKNGPTQRTDNATDVMINGEGFFVVTDDVNYDNKYYTRAGNFSLDRAGNLVTADGYKVLGYQCDEKGEATSTASPIRINRSETVAPTATNKIEFRGNLDSGTTSKDDPLFIDTVIKDSLGNSYTVKFKLKKNEAGENNTWTMSLDEIKSVDGETTIYKKGEGTDEVIENDNLSIELAFDTEGKLIKIGDNESFEEVSLKFKKEGIDKLTGSSFGKDNKIILFDENDLRKPLLHQYAGESDAKPYAENGNSSGTLNGFSIDASGVVQGHFTNGEKKALGQIMLAKFDNPMGLEKLGSNFFIDTRNSGEPQFGNPGNSGLGALNPGSLEMSNVDLSAEFTEMITTQRGFQANSRIITTSDEMLQELVNMKR